MFFMLRITLSCLLSGCLLGYSLFGQEKNGFDLSQATVPVDQIIEGGPPRDGIPAIDEPGFFSVRQAESFLSGGASVLGLDFNGQTKAYPIAILNYHEVVNDYFGDIPVVITYCPLCGSGVAFLAEAGGQVRTFGVSGLLYNSDVLLYDRETESLWSQLRMEALSGPAAGVSLRPLSLSRTSWASWEEQHPKTVVLSPETGHNRNYQGNPYPLYEELDQLFFPVNHEDDRLPPKTWVLGVEINGKFKAYSLETLADARRGKLTDSFQGHELTFHYDEQSQSAQVSSPGLETVPVIQLYWFAWAAFHPETAVYE